MDTQASFVGYMKKLDIQVGSQNGSVSYAGDFLYKTMCNSENSPHLAVLVPWHPDTVPLASITVRIAVFLHCEKKFFSTNYDANI